MPSKQPKATSDDIRAAYAAVVDYHNNLVQMRFTVAGLFLAANGLLASGFFQSNLSPLFLDALSVLGMGIAVSCGLLEVRTNRLLKNLGVRGLALERQLGLHEENGFFSLMEHQPSSPRNRVVRYLISHSFGIGLLYTLVILFWLFMIVTNA